MSNEIPALRQSTYEQMACPHSYGLVHIKGLRPPDTIQSFRGTEVHEVMAAYVEHCAARRVEADFSYFDGLITDTGDEATDILTTTRDNIKVDWQNFFAAEMNLGLDEDFKPTSSVLHDGQILPPDPLWNNPGSGKPTVYGGILDVIYLFPGGKAARIDDYKSHPRPFEPTTFQAKLYCLMLFMFMPELQEIEFVLRFVRYPNVVRPIKYFREQVPELKEEVRRQRARQVEYHRQFNEEGLEEMKAFAGTHCTYCPAVSNFKCPIAKLNPMLQLAPDQRLQYRLWYAAASRANNASMSSHVDGTGQSISTVDANGQTYTFGPVEKKEVTFPLFQYSQERGLEQNSHITNLLTEWMEEFAEDVAPTKRSPIPWVAKLKVGATELNRYMKTKKRADFHQRVMDECAQIVDSIEYRVARDAEIDDGTGEEHQTFNHADPNGDNAGASAPYEF